jgi:hypothetical protein
VIVLFCLQIETAEVRVYRTVLLRTKHVMYSGNAGYTRF